MGQPSEGEGRGPRDRRDTTFRRRALTRLLAVAVLGVLGVYVARVAGLLVTLQAAAGAQAALEAEVHALETEAAALDEAAVEAESEDYVERWAREERHWVRQGDRALALEDTPAGDDAASDPELGWLQRLKRWLVSPAAEAPPDAEPSSGGTSPAGAGSN